MQRKQHNEVPSQAEQTRGVVWCGVVWCAEGAGTKWQWPGCLAHRKMQNGWALILYPQSNRMPCLMGARCLVKNVSRVQKNRIVV